MRRARRANAAACGTKIRARSHTSVGRVALRAASTRTRERGQSRSDSGVNVDRSRGVDSRVKKYQWLTEFRKNVYAATVMRGSAETLKTCRSLGSPSERPPARAHGLPLPSLSPRLERGARRGGSRRRRRRLPETVRTPSGSIRPIARRVRSRRLHGGGLDARHSGRPLPPRARVAPPRRRDRDSRRASEGPSRESFTPSPRDCRHVRGSPARVACGVWRSTPAAAATPPRAAGHSFAAGGFHPFTLNPPSIASTCPVT